jgi:polar amino acid transport system substrate-binding protein
MKKVLYKVFFLYLFFPGIAFGNETTVLLSELPPYVENDSGLAIDIIQALFKRAKLEYKTEKAPLKRAIYWVKRNKNFCAPIQRSQERETKFKWVGPIIIMQTALFSREDDSLKIDVLKDAFKYKIMVARGSADAEYLHGFGAKIEIANNDRLNSNKLKRKRLRLWAADIIIAPYYAKKINLKIKKQLTINTTLVPLAFNINTPDHIIEKLNNTLNIMYKDGTVRKLYNRFR